MISFSSLRSDSFCRCGAKRRCKAWISDFCSSRFCLYYASTWSIFWFWRVSSESRVWYSRSIFFSCWVRVLIWCDSFLAEDLELLVVRNASFCCSSKDSLRCRFSCPSLSFCCLTDLNCDLYCWSFFYMTWFSSCSSFEDRWAARLENDAEWNFFCCVDCKLWFFVSRSLIWFSRSTIRCDIWRF